MKKIVLAIAAVAALSVPALASQRNSELPELASRADIMQPGSVSGTGEALFVVKGSGHTMTNFEALTAWSQLRSETNQH
jgi:photosystem II stability/assembly factor-like uncharacterized protein